MNAMDDVHVKKNTSKNNLFRIYLFKLYVSLWKATIC